MAAVTRRLRGWADRIQAFAQAEVEQARDLERAVTVSIFLAFYFFSCCFFFMGARQRTH